MKQEFRTYAAKTSCESWWPEFSQVRNHAQTGLKSVLNRFKDAAGQHIVAVNELFCRVRDVNGHLCDHPVSNFKLVFNRFEINPR
jgi:hypothetical protein